MGAAAVVLCTPRVDWGRRGRVREGSSRRALDPTPAPRTVLVGASSLLCPSPHFYSQKPTLPQGPSDNTSSMKATLGLPQQDLPVQYGLEAPGPEACLISVMSLDPTGSAQALGGQAQTLPVLPATLCSLPSPSTSNTNRPKHCWHFTLPGAGWGGGTPKCRL